MLRKNLIRIILIVIISIFINNPVISKTKYKWQEIKIEKMGKLKFKTPDDWKMRPTRTKESKIINYQLIPEKSKDLMVIITPFWKSDKKPFAKNVIVQMLINEGNKLLEISKETELEFKTIKNKRLICYYYGLTDSSSRPGKYNYVIRGGIRISNLLVSISIFTNDDNYKGINKALEMIKTFRHLKK